MSDRLTVKANTTLMPFLVAQLQGWSRSKIKQRLKGGCVRVNDALRLSISKPGTNIPLVFETPAPADFLALLQ